MIKVLTILQVLMVVCWFFPIALFARAAWRKSTGPHDSLRAAVWLAAVSVICFPVRWWVFGKAITVMTETELAVWSGLYVLGAIAALALTYATWNVCRGR